MLSLSGCVDPTDTPLNQLLTLNDKADFIMIGWRLTALSQAHFSDKN